MRQIIGKKIYDTEEALLLAEYWNGLGAGDFRMVSEHLYITKKGQFFLHCTGGAMTKYAEEYGNGCCEGEKIEVLDRDEAFEWMAKNNEVELAEEYFSDCIEEA